MDNNSLFFILKKFEPKDWSRFIKFVESPYFNINKRIVLFVKLLRKEIVAKRHPNKREAYKFLYPEKKEFEDSTFRSLTSELNQLNKKFLAIENMTKKDFSLNLLESHIKRNNTQGYLMEYNRMKKAEGIIELKNKSFYEESFKLSKTQVKFQTTNQQREDEKIDVALLDLNERLDLKYLVEKLQVISEMINRGTTINPKGQIISEQQMDSILKTKDEFFEQPLISIYIRIIDLLKKGTKSSYDMLKPEILKNIDRFTKSESKDMFEYLQNFCIQHINKGKSEYLNELFTLFQIQLGKEINVVNGQMRISDYKNIATVAIRLKSFTWVEDFTQKYQNSLLEKYRASAVAYNLSRIAFYREDYKDALRKLINVKYADVYYELGARILIIKIYFELSETELMLQNINSLKVFIKRNKHVSEYQKLIYSNFLRTMLKFQRILDGDNRALKVLDFLILEDKSIADYDWVLSKYEELKNPHSK